jgi:acyl-CoA thioester hydrolase
MLNHRTTYRVIYGDTDNMGQVYYGNYFRWFEIGRSEMFRSLGLPYKSVEGHGIFLPVSETYCKYSVSETYCKYSTPAKYDDIIVIETSLDTSVKGGVKFDYKIFAEDGQRLLARGFTKHACVDTTGKVVRPPKFLKDVIVNAENGGRKAE